MSNSNHSSSAAANNSGEYTNQGPWPTPEEGCPPMNPPFATEWVIVDPPASPSPVASVLSRPVSPRTPAAPNPTTPRRPATIAEIEQARLLIDRYGHPFQHLRPPSDPVIAAEMLAAIARIEADRLKRQQAAAEAKAQWARNYVRDRAAAMSEDIAPAGAFSLASAEESRDAIARTITGAGLGLLLAISVWVAVGLR
ncbi:MAG TPA: hypothetical protein PLD59_04530 [Tepidisphaeraceae bacterium]|nr:hypothetical protein [Tepidisphaeraceae bacterium]